MCSRRLQLFSLVCMWILELPLSIGLDVKSIELQCFQWCVFDQSSTPCLINFKNLVRRNFSCWEPASTSPLLTRPWPSSVFRWWLDRHCSNWKHWLKWIKMSTQAIRFFKNLRRCEHSMHESVCWTSATALKCLMMMMLLNILVVGQTLFRLWVYGDALCKLTGFMQGTCAQYSSYLSELKQLKWRNCGLEFRTILSGVNEDNLFIYLKKQTWARVKKTVTTTGMRYVLVTHKRLISTDRNTENEKKKKSVYGKKNNNKTNIAQYKDTAGLNTYRVLFIQLLKCDETWCENYSSCVV